MHAAAPPSPPPPPVSESSMGEPINDDSALDELYAVIGAEASHSLKSSSANLGAMALSAAAKRIELGARMETLDRPAVAVAMLTDEFERARAALQMRLRKRRTAEV